MPNPQPQGQKVQVKITDEVLKGFYSNMMQVTHTKEEFALDFMSAIGQQGIVGARVVVSPAHLKRIAAALAENLRKYEAQFGTINAGEPSPSKEIGFNIKDNS
jgi:hypothetical protein